ncbi:MAG: tetratricopeptide repeat protein, partial [Pirellulales bacterium]
MRRLCLTLFACSLVFACSARAQEAAEQPAADPAADAAVDEIGQQAAQLEAELGKLRDSSPEAAELLLQLIDLYHSDGRVFGLIRSGEKFVNNHPLHPQHGAAMVKLIDGLQAVARNKEIVGNCRQFLIRYPESAECARLEQVIADTLVQMSEPLRAAEAYEAVWMRQPTVETGRQAGVKAVQNYVLANNLEGFTGAAKLAEAMLDAYPAGSFATLCGQQAVTDWIRASQWAKSNLVGGKLLSKCPPKDPEQLRLLHMQMGENYSRLGQRANAVVSYKAARAITDSAYLQRLIIIELYNGAATGAELEPLVNEYFQKHADREDRFNLRSYVAVAYLRDGDKPKALAMMAELLPFDAVSNSIASVYARENGIEPAQLAQTEQVLTDAITKNANHANYLRYVLGLEHVRDRQKDLPRARQIIRDMLLKSPSNDSHTQQGLYWLLLTAPSDAEFQADVTAFLKVRTEKYHWTSLRQYLPNWIAAYAPDKEQGERAAWAKTKLDESEQQPFIKDWQATENTNRAVADAARAKLLAPASLPSLSDEQAKLLFNQLGYNYYYQGTPEERVRSATVYGAFAKKFPQDYHAAYSYLFGAIGYGPPEVAKEAALHLLTIEPIDDPTNYNAYYMLVQAADRNMDVDLLKRALSWILKSQQKFGLGNLTYSDSIGDILDKHGLAEEALAFWKNAAKQDYNNSYSRTTAGRILAKQEPEARIKSLQNLAVLDCDFHGAYAMLLADEYLKAGDLDSFEKTLKATRAKQLERPFRGWGIEEYPTRTWVDNYRAGKDFTDAQRLQVFTAVRDLKMGRPSAIAGLAILELPTETPLPPTERLIAYANASTEVYDASDSWDWLAPYAQAAMIRRDYTAVASLVSAMLVNIPNIDPTRLQSGRDMVAQSYARMGTVGLSIDENSPIAPLLQAALYLRLGDTRLALDAYTKNKPLFDEHRNELPVDLILFVCDGHIAAGGEENFERAEDILRNWLVKFSEAMDVDASTKARVQVMLAKTYFRAQRFDVARGEYTTVINRYPGTPEATEAEFGIGESFMAQKVYDQAEAVFEKLSNSKERDTIVRAEFLRGVLASRRGDRDEARDIFKAVLEKVPSVELANQTLFNLAEVYGAEQRYMDQLELLRTVGRLGRASKRWHTPGVDLSIVVQDGDLGISRGHARIPVRVTTQPGGDEETIYLYSGGAGKGLFRTDLETRLDEVTKGDRILQLTGRDTIFCDYPDEFKADFKSVPLSDAEIKIAANAKLEVASTKIVDKDKETFSERLARETREEQERDRPVSQNRPSNQIKPGNPIFLRVADADRDMSNEMDKISVMLSATSGDQVRVDLQETGPHTGLFEGTSVTAELPAGALASDTAIDHSPLMAIDQDPSTFWLSEPDGATPKSLAVDMKDLKAVDHVTVTSPDASSQVPVRGILEGSHDGRFFYRLASVPPQPRVEPVAGDYNDMTMRVYAGYYLNYTTWQQIIDLSKNEKPVEESLAEQLTFSRQADDTDAAQAYGVIWHGKFVQPRSGAVRFGITAARSALVIDGEMELALDNGVRTVDVWLEQGLHDMTVFACTPAATQPISVMRAPEDQNNEQIILGSFRSSDFDLQQPAAKPAAPRAPAVVKTDNGVWDFEFDSTELRHVRLVVQEYLGEAVAISHVQISGEDESEPYIPTKSDVLALANNDTLEIAAGDLITATYTDEFTQTAAGRSQLLNGTLQATYFNARLSPIAYDFVRERNGAVTQIRKQLIRIDPGERFIVEITDYDEDRTEGRDELTFQVAVNDDEPIKLVALETEFAGTFTKEVDTAEVETKGKLVVKPGDRIYCSYVDSQNTFPGHAMARETVVYVNQPSN